MVVMVVDVLVSVAVVLSLISANFVSPTMSVVVTRHLVIRLVSHCQLLHVQCPGVENILSYLVCPALAVPA